MDGTGNEDERSLPGLGGGMSKWMRRSDRPDFMDMCAASPPADGFFYPNQQRVSLREQKSQIGCTARDQSTKEEVNISKTYIPNFTGGEEQKQNNIACMQGDQSGFFKNFTPTNYPTTTGDSVTDFTSRPVFNMEPKELEMWARRNIAGETLHASDDSAPTPIDHLGQYKRIRPPQITKTEETNSSMRLIDRLTTPDVTPCTTPLVTPVCSPQVPRKIGNPFFSGEMNPRKDDGSWLFRPGPKNTSDHMLYEAKVEIQPATSTQGGSKNIRYVPRPSKLRELNFFSPTSM